MPSLVKKWQSIQKELDEEEKSSSSDEDRDLLNKKSIEEWKQQQLSTYVVMPFPFTLGFNFFYFLKWALLVFTAFSPSFTLISVIINNFFSIFTEEKLQRMPTLRHCPRTGGNAWRKGRWTARNIRSGSYTVQAMFLKTTPTTVIRLSFPSLEFSLNLNF